MYKPTSYRPFYPWEVWEGKGAFLSILFLLFVFLSLSLPSSPCHKFGWFLAISMGGWYKKGRRRGRGGGEKCERGRVWAFLSTLILGSFLFSPSPLVPTINQGGPSPLVWVAGTRGGGGRKGGKFERGREPFFCSLSLPFRLLPHKLQ